MSEARTRSTLIKLLKPLHGTPIESQRTGVGIPDVFFIGGVIEVKKLIAWPSNPDTVVRLSHPLTREQWRYLVHHDKLGGKAWVCLQANRNEWMLFDPENAKYLRRGYEVDRATLTTCANHRWIGVPDQKEFLDAVSYRLSQ